MKHCPTCNFSFPDFSRVRFSTVLNLFWIPNNIARRVNPRQIHSWLENGDAADKSGGAGSLLSAVVSVISNHPPVHPASRKGPAPPSQTA